MVGGTTILCAGATSDHLTFLETGNLVGRPGFDLDGRQPLVNGDKPEIIAG